MKSNSESRSVLCSYENQAGTSPSGYHNSFKEKAEAATRGILKIFLKCS